MNNYVAFFDLDHTIFGVNSGRILIEHAHKKGLIHTKQIILAYLFSVLYGIGLLKAEYIMIKLADWLKGIVEEEFAKFADKIFEEYLKSSIRLQAINEIERHKKNKAHLVILSAATQYICEPAKKLMNFNDIICSRMEVIDGIFSGKPDGLYCYGDEKLNQIIAYCTEHNFDLEQAYYYADSYSDLNVLKAVGKPVCVTPEHKLKKIAVKYGWPVQNW